MSNTYCPFINHQLMVDFRGKASACCQFTDSSSLENYNSMMKPHRDAMNRGEKMKPCQRCWDDEAAGFPSLRRSAIKDFSRYPPADGIMIIDIRITNKCNLACIMCNDHASSLWGKLTGSNLSYSLDNDLKNQVLKQSDNLIKISIQGGEPFYGNEFIDFIDQLPNKSNVILEIFSNGVTTNIDVLKKWATEFKSVMLFVSVDGHGQTFEKIRWPALWPKFERKIEQLKEIENVLVNFNFTLQALNVHNIGDFINWRNAVVPNFSITISKLEHPEYFRFNILTEEERLQAIDAVSKIKNAKGMESLVIKSIKNELINTTINEKLLDIKHKQLFLIEQQRNNLVRPERLELSTSSTSS